LFSGFEKKIQKKTMKDWNGKLAPTARRTYGRPDPMGQRSDCCSEKVEREDIFKGVSARARTTVFQFIWELKLRVFTEGEILEQELRKEPDDRVFLKLVQPQSMDALRRRSYDNWFWKILHFVDGTMPAFSSFAAATFSSCC
jgi:hypothetical protein